ncbi:unnamed protein product, partial [Discosporangium mesarthrocarpum]
MSQQLDQLMDDYDQKRISRRELIALLLTSVAASNTAQSQTAEPVAFGRSMNHVSLSVADVNRS